jgi:Holliday junction resolvase
LSKLPSQLREAQKAIVRAGGFYVTRDPRPEEIAEQNEVELRLEIRCLRAEVMQLRVDIQQVKALLRGASSIMPRETGGRV